MSSSVGVSPGATGRQPRDIADPDKRRAAELDRAKFLSETREAIAEIRSRPVTAVPGTLGAIGEMVRENIVAEIEKGATPIRVTDESGKKITVGALRGEKYTGRSEYEAIARETGGTAPIQISEVQARQPIQEREETPTLITPEVTPEVTPVADAVGGLMGEDELGRGRRTKRAGGAGTLLEGGGFLYGT
jgi:hypothetical protein